MKKNLMIAAIGILFITVQIFAQETQKRTSLPSLEKRIESGKKNVLVALHSENDGVIESAIMFTAKLKLVDPSVEITKLQNVLEELSTTHPSATIRYKAFLASNLCNNPALYTQENLLQTNIPETFFHAVSQCLQKKIFGMNSL